MGGTRQRSGQNRDQKRGIGVGLTQQYAMTLSVVATLDDEDEADDLELESDPEPDQTFDDGDLFDDRPHPLPDVRALPLLARPRVEYAIDPGFSVRSLMPADRPIDAERLAIVEAIAKWLQDCRVPLVEIGDWRHIPRMPRTGGLLGTVTHLELFAITLPSGDVIVPDTLFDRAFEDSSLTRGGAWRDASRPSPLRKRLMENERESIRKKRKAKK